MIILVLPSYKFLFMNAEFSSFLLECTKVKLSIVNNFGYNMTVSNAWFKGAYWIIQLQIHHLSNIAISILDFSLLLPIKLSIFQLLRQQ